ncbi:MAG TPA: hypothetical protein VM889_13115 [Candidatus Thermoplasmatota archaeon]|nr:hypothetical protein [Candidatus Thermoplasmatota archaeon]
MALWRVRFAFPDGTHREQVFAAGNRDAARERAKAAAEKLGARLEGEPVVADPSRGSL